MGNRNRKKEGNPIVAIAVILIVLIISAGGGAAIPILLVLGAVGYSIYIAAKRSNSANKTDSDSDTAAAPQSFDPRKFADDARRSISKVLTQDMKKHDFDDCGDDHEHVEPSYNMPADVKRREQLKSMLKNGLIEKDEYQILLRKYNLE